MLLMCFGRGQWCRQACCDTVCAHALAATQVTTQSWMEPQSVDILFAGYPCVDLSGLNARPGIFTDKKRQTGMGYHATMQYIAKYQPKLVALENVRQIACARAVDKKAGLTARPIDIQNAALAELGHGSAWTICDARKHSLPQSRKRAWMFYIRRGCGDVTGVIPMMRKFETKPWPLASVVLTHAKPAKQDKGRPRAKPSKRSAAKAAKWKQQLKAAIEKGKFKREQVNDIIAKLSDFDLTEREVSCIAINKLKLQSRGVDTDVQQVVIQVDQSIDRTNVRKDIDLCPCIVPHGKYFVTCPAGVLDAAAHLALQGVGAVELTRYKVLEQLNERQAKNMAGNAFAATICAAGLLTLLTAWRRE